MKRYYMRKIEREILSLEERCQRNQGLFISGAVKPNLCPCLLMEKEKAEKVLFACFLKSLCVKNIVRVYF